MHSPNDMVLQAGIVHLSLINILDSFQTLVGQMGPWLVAGAVNGPPLLAGLLTAPATNLVITMRSEDRVLALFTLIQKHTDYTS